MIVKAMRRLGQLTVVLIWITWIRLLCSACACVVYRRLTLTWTARWTFLRCRLALICIMLTVTAMDVLTGRNRFL